VRAISSNGALDISRPFHSAYPFSPRHESIPRYEWSMLGPQPARMNRKGGADLEPATAGGGADACLFHRNGGPVTTILSREGKSPRMTVRMCRISSRRDARRGAIARRPRHLAADRSASSNSRKELDARLEAMPLNKQA
jgi:hypothetical protein